MLSCLPFAHKRRLYGAALALSQLLGVSTAYAEIVEPNGTVVPGQPAADNEIPLWTFFENEGEAIDAVATASIEPGTFSPRCDFEATLVLSESQAEAGLAWYNVPADPNAAPSAIYELLAPTTTTGTVIHSADIITSPDYEGGLIGFALTKSFDGGATAQAIYYSEYQRNELCSACDMPDHWKMMLSYGSTVYANTFYLAFEDWEGANQETWYGNDGDFNDKVFRVTGVTCLGGGEPCDTGKLGHCAAGLTECQPGGTLGCRQQIPESDEVCDNIDNDCNGEVDDGAPCPPGEVCREGSCEPPCGGGEFRCPADLYCTTEGLCIDRDCVDITCEAGEVCKGGVCVGACDDVVCPLGQQCQLGRCVDPCANITCEGSTVCDRGVCVEPCNCRPCAAELACAESGACVEPGCETLSCEVGQACSAGACQDACAGALCPGGAECTAGQCGEPPGGGGAGGATGTSSGSSSVGSGGTFSLPSDGSVSASSGAVPTAASSSASGGGSQQAAGDREAESSGGCACRLMNHTHSGTGSGAGLLLLGLGVRQRRRTRRRQSKKI